MEFKEFITKKIPAALKFAARKTWAYIKIARIELIVLVSILALDLISKGLIQAAMDEGQRVPLIPKFLHFYYIINEFAAFGSVFGLENVLGQEVIRIFLIVFTVPALCVFGYCMVRVRKKRLLPRIIFAMIIAGTLGNFFDRLFITNSAGVYGVRDFIQFVCFGLSFFGIFNIADASLVIGVVLFAVYYIFIYKSPKPEIAGPVYRADYKPEQEYTQESAEESSDG